MKKLNNLCTMFLCITLISLLSACSGGGGATSTTSTATSGLSFSFNKAALVSAKTAGKSVASATLDPAAKYAAVTVTDSNDNTVLSNYKVDIYTLNDSYITATIPLPPGNYKLTQFFVLDSNNNILYLVPTQSATADIKKLVSVLLPMNFGVTKDIANTISLQILAVGAGTTTNDYGYPSVIFDVVTSTTIMISVQTLDSTANNWLLIDAALKLNNADYAIPAQETSVLQVATADNYTLVFSKTGYVTKTITLTSTEIANYQTAPLVVVLTPSVTQPSVVPAKDVSSYNQSSYFVVGSPVGGSAQYAFDDLEDTIWSTYRALNGQDSQWISWTYSSPKTISKVAMVFACNRSNSVTLQGSNDATNWTSLSGPTNLFLSVGRSEPELTIPTANQGSYTSYRLLFDVTGQDGYIYLRDLTPFAVI